MDDRVLITVSEAARRLDTYPNAINRWIARGELEAFRVEGRVFRFVDAEHVEALRLALLGLKEQRHTPVPSGTPLPANGIRRENSVNDEGNPN
jgi:excisionase family DNA binding protein